jgi:CheY-like chemotaxis protein
MSTASCGCGGGEPSTPKYQDYFSENEPLDGGICRKVEKMRNKVFAFSGIEADGTSREECPMIARTYKPLTFRPRLVMAYADSIHAALSARHLRRLGWEVHLASSGPEARRLARALAPEVVILDTQLPDESGWLTCAKLMMENGTQKVMLVSADITPEEERLAATVGAATIVERQHGVLALIDQVMDKALPHAG